MFISKNIFVHRKVQKKKKKLEQYFFKKKMTEKKEIEIEKTAKNKKKLFTITIHTTYKMTYHKLDELLTIIDGLKQIFILSFFCFNVK